MGVGERVEFFRIPTDRGWTRDSGPAFVRRSRGDYISVQGGTGYGVRLLAELAGRLAG